MCLFFPAKLSTDELEEFLETKLNKKDSVLFKGMTECFVSETEAIEHAFAKSLENYNTMFEIIWFDKTNAIQMSSCLGDDEQSPSEPWIQQKVLINDKSKFQILNIDIMSLSGNEDSVYTKITIQKGEEDEQNQENEKKLVPSKEEANDDSELDDVSGVKNLVKLLGLLPPQKYE